MNIDKNNLEKFLNYLQDKIQECYKQETKQAINRYMEELKGVDENVKETR